MMYSVFSFLFLDASRDNLRVWALYCAMIMVALVLVSFTAATLALLFFSNTTLVAWAGAAREVLQSIWIF